MSDCTVINFLYFYLCDKIPVNLLNCFITF